MCASGQPRLRRLGKLMSNVGKISRIWSHARRDFQRLFYAKVSRMRFIAKRVDDQNLYARDKIDNCIRDTAAITHVGDKFLAAAREEIAVHYRISVRHEERCDQRATQFESPITHVRLRLQITRTCIQAIKV